MDVIDRINQLKSTEDLSFDRIAQLTGLGTDRWKAVLYRRVKIRFEDVEAISAAFPEYKHWIVFGEEIPESGQISPMTKAAQQELRTQGKAD